MSETVILKQKTYSSLTKPVSSPRTISASPKVAQIRTNHVNATPNQIPPKIIKATYQLADTVGKGAFGRVYRSIDLSTGHLVVVKETDKKALKQDQLIAVARELEILQTLDHPNIVKMLDSLESPNSTYLILEFVEGGSLHDLMTKCGGSFPEPLLRLYMPQLLSALDHLHRNGLVHRDVKGSNVLLTKDGRCKLADFGSCTYCKTKRRLSMAGTPFWAAPELISGVEATGCVDIWSVGCTLIELRTSRPPYWALGSSVAMYRMAQDDHPPLPPDISNELNEFLKRCFVKDGDARPPASELLGHSWLTAECLSFTPKSPHSPGPSPLSRGSYSSSTLNLKGSSSSLLTNSKTPSPSRTSPSKKVSTSSPRKPATLSRKLISNQDFFASTSSLSTPTSLVTSPDTSTPVSPNPSPVASPTPSPVSPFPAPTTQNSNLLQPNENERVVTRGRSESVSKAKSPNSGSSFNLFPTRKRSSSNAVIVPIQKSEPKKKERKDSILKTIFTHPFREKEKGREKEEKGDSETPTKETDSNVTQKDSATPDKDRDTFEPHHSTVKEKPARSRYPSFLGSLKHPSESHSRQLRRETFSVQPQAQASNGVTSPPPLPFNSTLSLWKTRDITAKLPPTMAVAPARLTRDGRDGRSIRTFANLQNFFDDSGDPFENAPK